MNASTAAGPQPRAEIDCLMTGEEYLESLRDAREVYIYGERVRDVTTHPAFRNAARSIVRLYDSLHDPAQRDLLTTVDDYGIRTHKFFAPSKSAAELLAARDAIAAWARLSYGFLGRTPDYKAAFIASLGANPEFYEPFADNARAWYRKFASRALFLNHVLVNPPVDRHKPVHEVGDVYLHLVEERDDGIVVDGAKMLATGSALTHGTFVAQNSSVSLAKGKAEDFALVFIADMDTKGAKLLCRSSYEDKAVSPFDHPLSSRFDENDAVLVFDRAFIPWENVLVYRDVEKANGFYRASGFFNRYNLQAGTRLGVKLDFMAGLFGRAIAANGTDEFRGVQAALGEIVGWRNLMWALTTTLCLDPQPGPGNSVIPKTEHAATIRLFSHRCWPEIHQIFSTCLGGSPLAAPSSYKDLLDDELRPLIDRYYRGSDSSAGQRVKLFKLIWDAMGTEFGARHALYERNYAGNNDQIRLDVVNFARIEGHLREFDALVERCMSDYDLNGWTVPAWEWERKASTRRPTAQKHEHDIPAPRGRELTFGTARLPHVRAGPVRSARRHVGQDLGRRCRQRDPALRYVNVPHATGIHNGLPFPPSAHSGGSMKRIALLFFAFLLQLPAAGWAASQDKYPLPQPYLNWENQYLREFPELQRLMDVMIVTSTRQLKDPTQDILHNRVCSALAHRMAMEMKLSPADRKLAIATDLLHNISKEERSMVLTDPRIMKQASAMMAKLRAEKQLTGSPEFWTDTALFANKAIGDNLSLIHHITGAITAGEILGEMKGFSAQDILRVQAAIVGHSTGYWYFRKSVDDAAKQPGAWRKVFPEPEGDLAKIAHDADLISQFEPESVVPDGSKWRVLAAKRWGAKGTVEEAHVVYYVFQRLFEEAKTDIGKTLARQEWNKIEPQLVKLAGLKPGTDPIEVLGVPKVFQ